jgi:hypothetical protein
MSETAVTTKRKLRPARKQVKPGEIDKSEGPQPGKEYSMFCYTLCRKRQADITLKISGIINGLEVIKKML